METQLVELELADWDAAASNEALITALEAGKVLYFRGSLSSRCPRSAHCSRRRFWHPAPVTSASTRKARSKARATLAQRLACWRAWSDAFAPKHCN
ncbi:MAG: hypothetical protein WKG52_03375 [Variovorax sp.]